MPYLIAIEVLFVLLPIFGVIAFPRRLLAGVTPAFLRLSPRRNTGETIGTFTGLSRGNIVVRGLRIRAIIVGFNTSR